MNNLSQTEENYIKALYHLSSGADSVSTNALASNMNTTPASVNDMLKRLDQKGMLSHVKYKGATITEKGKTRALKVIRKHRLWEVFLVEKLGFHWDEVHEVAEQLEHVISPLLTERLDDFLGKPKFDPHGDPIPDADGNLHQGPQEALANLKSGNRGILVKVANDDPLLLQHLDGKGIRLGQEMKIEAIQEFDGSLEITIDGLGQQFISDRVAQLLMVSIIENNE